jgi:tetratricopeptide (TPR) repeat protein
MFMVTTSFKRPRYSFILLALTALLGNGCGGPVERNASDTSAAALNRQGLAASDPLAARQLFTQATQIDPLYGPAFHNLGITLLRQGAYYQAATAFDTAIRLMPQNPAPRLYLGLVYEEAGQFPTAVDYYQQALELAPDDIETVQALTRTLVRLERVDATALAHLRRIAIQGTSDEWRLWAGHTLTRLGANETPLQAPP